MLHVANPEGRTAITKQPSRTWASRWVHLLAQTHSPLQLHHGTGV